MKFIVDRFLLLPIGAAVALTWANLAGDSYFRVAHTLVFPVNEVGMALFLGLLAQEVIEALLPGVALHGVRRWSLPVIAATGGTVGAVFSFLAYVQFSHELVLASAWPVVCAIDMAAGYYVLKLIMPRSAAVPFFLVVAALTNLFGLLVVVVRPGGTGLDPLGLLVIGLALAGAVTARSIWSAGRPLYAAWILCAVASWIGFYVAGLHPALALLPLVPFLPHESRREVFADPPDDDEIHHFEHRWNLAVQVVLFFFGFVNGGVLLRGADTGTWAVLVAVLAGRPLGMIAAVGVAEAAGLRLPGRIAWRQIFVVALAASSGFTFALFFASSVLPVGAVLQQVKVGALVSVIGALLTVCAAWLLLVRPGLGRRGGPVFASSARY